LADPLANSTPPLTSGRVLSLLKGEWFLAASVLTCAVFWLPGETIFGSLSNPWVLAGILAWLLAAVLGSAIAVVRHADALAERLGEPYGTLILTLAVTSIEVMSISAVMMHGDNNPTLARDTLFAVTMIILNGMIGLSLLLGGWRYREQQYNLQGANAYLGVIIPLGVIALVMPNFTTTTQGPTLSSAQEIFFVVMSASLYSAFLFLQTRRHRGYFTHGGAIDDDDDDDDDDDAQSEASRAARAHAMNPYAHAILLLAYMAPVVYLAERLARPVDYLIETMHAPVHLGGLAIAILVATPEAIGAVRAAAANNLQRSINIFLGSVLSTIGLTVPAIIIISHFTHHPIELGLQHTDQTLFILTLGMCVVNFSSGRTNVLQGGVHLMLFAAYLFLIFEG
jgi:Ca2+:H+ antiporter